MRAKDHVRAKNKYLHVAGVDEVGRGPLAGDVVAAAVILPTNHGIEGLADSKKLTEKKRLQLYQDIKTHAVAWCVDRASVAEIDELNILQASLLAMRRAVDGLNISPDFVKVDGNKLPVWSYPSESIVKGDSTVEAISAASILAKVDRDNEMVELDQRHPVYGFAQHKGYPTKQHLAALGLYGVTPYHRKTFAPVARVLPSDE